MRLQSSKLRNSLLFVFALGASCCLIPTAYAQQSDDSDATASAKLAAAKMRAQQAKAAANAPAVSEKESVGNRHKDSADEIRKRDEWFYKQRASVNGHIPAGARARALQHMQRMMLREGKLVQRPDGSYVEVAPNSQLSPLGAVTNTWASVGPTPTTGGTFSPVTGRITTIAVDPSDATGNTVLIGGAQGGIWRTTDGGTTWTAVGDQNASLSMGSIAFAPSAPLTVYAGTGEQASIGFDIYYGEGVLKSTDGGLHWTQTCTTPSASCPFIGPYSDATIFGFFTLGGTRISYVAVNPSNPQMVLVAAQTQFSHGSTEGVYCSADGGSTWNIVPTASGDMATFVGFASSTVAFAALGNSFSSATANGIYKSTNASSCSLTFTNLAGLGGLPASSAMGRIDMGISPLYAAAVPDNTVYASIANHSTTSTTNLGVFVSTTGGTSWTRTAAPDICQFQCWYDNVVKVDPNGGAHAFFAGGAVTDASNNPIWVMRTADTGSTWATVIPSTLGPGLPHVDNHAFAFVKLSTGKIRLYLGNDGGIWRTDDAESATLPLTWMNLNDSLLTLSQFYPAISIHPSTPGIAFAGTQDNGCQIYDQAVTGTTWTDNGVCGDGTGTAIDNVIPSTVYVTTNGNNIQVSTQVGQVGTYVSAVNGINPNDNLNFVPPLVTDPSAANVVYTGTTKVYQSVNTGTLWTALSGDLVNGANRDSLIALAVAPKNSAVVYAGANTGAVFVATNVSAGTGTFNAVTGQASLPPRQVSAISVDPADATGKTAYAAFSGFSFVGSGINDPKGHLFKTTDAGATWTDVSCTVADCATPAAIDLPNTPVNDVVVDPDTPNPGSATLYAATDIGVFQGICTTTAPFTCTWTTLSSGLPRVTVLSLKLHSASRTLFAATHGRGTWTIQLNNFSFTGPHISSISPVSATAGAAQFTLTVNGNGLTNGAVQWNGSVTNVTTQQVSDTQLTATIAASLVSGSGTPPITVKVGAATSNALTFTVLGTAPTISSVSPISAPVNTANPVTITVNGTGFSASSKVLMNPDFGTMPIATTFVSATQLTATVPVSFMANFGSTNSVGVQNPPPGGGTTTSNTQVLPTFTVVAPPPANDNFVNAINITGTSFADTKDSSGATTESVDPITPCAGATTNTIWYKFTPGSNGTITDVDTIGSNYDTVLSIWTGTAGSLTNVACNDDINPGIILVSQIQNLPVTAGVTYYVMVSSFGLGDPNPIAFGGKSVFNFSFSGTAAAPTISSLNPTSGPVGTSVTITGTNFGTTQGTSTVTFNGTAATQVTWGTTGTSITAVVPTGATTGPVVVTVGGIASNGVTFTVGNPVPTISSLSPASATAGSAAFTLTVNGTGFVSGSQVNFNGNARTTTFVSATQITAAITAADIATAGTFPVTVTNAAPGGGTSAAATFTVNNPVPAITSLSPTGATAGGAAFTLTVNGTNFVSTSVVQFNGNAKTTTFVSATQLTAAILASDIATAGSANVTVINPTPGGGTSTMVVFNIASSPNPVPTLTSISPTSVTAGGAAFTLTVNGTNFVSSSVVNFNGSARTTTFVSGTQLTAAITAADLATAGSFPITVFNPAPGGGTSSAINLTVNNPVPAITSLSPSSTTVGGAAFTLTVNGTNFVSGSTVNFNGSARTTTFVSATQVTAAITAADIASVGTFPVTVTNPTPGGGTSTAATFTVTNPPPAITSLSPSSATAGGAAFTLTVNGTGFVSGATVNFNGSAKTTAFVSATQLTASILAADIATAGMFNVTVTNPAPGGGTSAAATFTVNNPAPTITSLSPTSTTAGGAAFSLTVNGTNFVSTSVVNFNGTAKTTTFVSATQLTAAVAAADIATGANVNVTVTNPAPGGGTSAASPFTINNPFPSITSISPTSTTAGGPAFTLTVNGSNFVPSSVVQFGIQGIPLTTTFVSSTKLTANVPASDIASAGPSPVAVFNPTPGGGNSGPTAFTINNPVPTITSISPTSATAGGAGFTLTVNGTGFFSNTIVNWNGANRPTTFVSATQLTAAIPASDIAAGGTATVTAFNPPPAGGSSTGVTFTINNAAPTLTSLSPSSANAGGGAFPLTINGSNFVTGATVNFGANPALTPTAITAGQILVIVPAADIATAGTPKVTVTNPSPTVGPSAALTFTVNNPMPTVTGVTAAGNSHAPAGAAFTLTVNGTNFVSTSVVNFNLGGTAKAESTTFVSATQLTASIPASDVSSAGTAMVTVTNPSPGGGTSAATNFTIDGYSVTGPANTNVKGGQPAMIQITVTPTANGFANAVMLSVSGLPKHSMASFSSPSVTPGNTASNSTLTISTTAGSAMPPMAPVTPPVPPPLRLLPLLWFAALLAGICLMQLSRRVPRLRRYAAAIPLALLLITGVALAGCASNAGTPKGPAQLTITATSGTMTQTANITLTVQ